MKKYRIETNNLGEVALNHGYCSAPNHVVCIKKICSLVSMCRDFKISLDPPGPLSEGNCLFQMLSLPGEPVNFYLPDKSEFFIKIKTNLNDSEQVYLELDTCCALEFIQ